MKSKSYILFAFILVLTLCACTPSTPTEVDTTTKFVSEGFTLSIPNEYADLLVINTTVYEENGNTFFSVHEKASLEACKTMFPDDEPSGGFLFSIGRVTEDQFHEMMMWGMTGADVFARDGEGNYYLYYHPTDVQLLRVEYTDADWEQWTKLCEWAADADLTFLLENPGLRPYERTYTDIDCALHYIAYGDGFAHLTQNDGDVVYTPEHATSIAYLEQMLDDVMFYPLQGDPDFDLEGNYITLTAPDMFRYTSFDFFIDEGQQQYIRQNFEDIEPLYFVASKDGQEFPAGKILADWWFNALV